MSPDERPVPDPGKLLAAWDEWERGEQSPGTVMKNLKIGGLRVLLEALVEHQGATGTGTDADVDA